MRKVCAKDTFEEVITHLLNKKALSDITVSQIVEQSGLTRQSFYLHYIDKFDLVNQIFHNDAEKCRRMFGSSEHQMDQIILVTLELMQDKRNFYINAFKYNEQNSLASFVEEETYNVHSRIVLPKAAGLVAPEKASYCLHFYSRCVSSAVTNWASSGMRESPRDLSYLIFDCMPHIIKHFYDCNSLDDLRWI